MDRMDVRNAAALERDLLRWQTSGLAVLASSRPCASPDAGCAASAEAFNFVKQIETPCSRDGIREG